jgi:glucose/mannose-6-phosphate isomerase
MIDLIFSQPEQLATGQELGIGCRLFRVRTIENVVVSAMGGSAIGGDVTRTILGQEINLPVVVQRDYHLPVGVTNRTMLVAISYSGNTEETLTAYDEAKKKTAKIIAITSGGKLAEKARQDGVPLLVIPGGMPPRCALGLVTVPLLVVLNRLGVCRSYVPDIQETARLLEKNLSGWHRWAKMASRRFAERFFIIYSTSRLLDVAAYRWQCQLNENAKMLAHWGALPEQSHNELMGYGAPKYLNRKVALFAFIDRTTHYRTVLRLQQMLRLIGDVLAAKLILETAGRTALARLFSIIVRGDLLSVELARERGVDPMVIPKIDRLKQTLAGKGRGD